MCVGLSAKVVKISEGTAVVGNAVDDIGNAVGNAVEGR